MTDFEKKFQNKIAQVKGLKGGIWDEVHRKLILGSNYVYLRNWYKDHIMKF